MLSNDRLLLFGGRHDGHPSVPKNETAAMLVYQLQFLWELNSFLMQMLSFVPINLHRGWPGE